MSYMDSNSSSNATPSYETRITRTPDSNNMSRRLRNSNRLPTVTTATSPPIINSFSTNKSEKTTMTNFPPNSVLSTGQTALFMETIRSAMAKLMQDYGYSRERAQISLLDQLVSIHPYPKSTMEAVVAIDVGSSSMMHPVTSSALQPSPLAVSDMKVFDVMRKKNIGMGHATISIVVEQTISSILNDPTSMYSSVSEILDMWTTLLQHVQPKPLTRLMVKSAQSLSSFGSPHAIQMTTKTPALSRRPKSTPSTTSSKSQQKNPPSTPVSTMEASNSKVISSSNRTKVGGKKSRKTIDSPPPPSTITIATPSSAQPRARADSVAEAVSAKMTSSSTHGVDDNNSVPTSKGKPPLAPNTNIALSSTIGGNGNASMTGRSNGSATSLNSSCKRTNVDTSRLEQQQQIELSSSYCGRPSSPTSSVLTSSNKRQRRSTSMSGDN